MEHIDITGSTHNTNPNKKWAHKPEGLDYHEVCIIKHENPIERLQDCQNPDSLNLDEFEAAPGKEHTNLITSIQDNKISTDSYGLTLIWVLVAHFLSHGIRKTCNNGVLEEVDGKQIDYEVDSTAQEESDVLAIDFFVA